MKPLPAALLERLTNTVIDPDRRGRHIAIIGGGWSGVAAAIHLLQRGDDTLSLYILERGPGLGRGVAYGTEDPGHILNVPAGRMSLDPAHPDEFLDYARRQGSPASPSALLPRQLYGDYVIDRLARTVGASRGQVQLIRKEATGLTRGPRGWEVSLSDGAALSVSDVILATGHGAPRLPEALAALSDEAALLKDPWESGALARLPNDARLLLIGSGLTALDLLGTLRRQGHRGPLEVLSLTGEWPRPHLASILWEQTPFEIKAATLPKTTDALAAWFQEAFASAKALGIPWQAVMDAFRPHTVEVWRGLSLEERRRFLTHWRPTWELYRHRAPRPQWEALRAWEAEGWVTRTAGTLSRADKTDEGFALQLQERDQLRPRRVDHIIIATGPEADVERLRAPLWRQLLAERIVEPDPLRLGIVTDDRGAVLQQGAVVPGLWTLGSLLRPQFFESTAVPDLSKRAVALSNFMLSQGG